MEGSGSRQVALDYAVSVLREYTGMTPEEFLSVWDSGELDPENPVVVLFIPTIPLLREVVENEPVRAAQEGC